MSFLMLYLGFNGFQRVERAKTGLIVVSAAFQVYGNRKGLRNFKRGWKGFGFAWGFEMGLHRLKRVLGSSWG